MMLQLAKDHRQTLLTEASERRQARAALTVTAPKHQTGERRRPSLRRWSGRVVKHPDAPLAHSR
jgi:hypothetical protein